MTIGIYALVWNHNYDSIYVGQSINIEARYKQHLDLLENNNHYNYKIINATNLYGKPDLYVLEELDNSYVLDEREIFWIEEFNSINFGMNIASGGISGRGLNHSNSKYSKFKILKIFSYLYKTMLPYEEIARKCKVNKYLVHNIVSGLHHLWLKDTYPVQFQIMLDNKTLRSKYNRNTYGKTGKSHPPLVSPIGEVFSNITNIAEFCRTHPLLNSECDTTKSNIAKVLKGTKKSHKGWHLLST